VTRVPDLPHIRLRSLRRHAESTDCNLTWQYQPWAVPGQHLQTQQQIETNVIHYHTCCRPIDAMGRALTNRIHQQ
jgi:hypothetical protein